MASLYIGLMSGTSMDAVDAVLIDFSDSLKLLATHNQTIPIELKRELTALAVPGDNEIERLMRADVVLGKLFSQAVKSLLNKAGSVPSDVLAIGSHGQTIRHYPDAAESSTLQIGDPNIIAQQTGITTIADIRRRDMAAGGQGAPLVPAFHEAMFRNASSDCVIINIGGMANLTLLPKDKNKPVTGFDTGPGNVLLDGWVNQHLNKAYDSDGAWAATGTENKKLTNTLLDDDYFRKAPPKSTGREHFNLDWLQKSLNEFAGLKPEDVQASLLVLTASSIVQAIDQTMPEVGKLHVCGGGVHNSGLMSRIRTMIGKRQLLTTDSLGITPEWVEACAVAWLAKQTLEGKPGNLPAVTGASEAVILGGIYNTRI